MQFNKNIISVIFTMFLGLSLAFGQAQEPKVKTVEFEVSGVCMMCKERIESAALIKGVRFAEWNKDTKLLKVIFKTKLTEESNIHKAVAKAGHDTKKEKATDEVYKNLPACCAYRDGVETH